jgi:hypothetical protein
MHAPVLAAMAAHTPPRNSDPWELFLGPKEHLLL